MFFVPVLFVERLKDIFVAASSSVMGDNSAIIADLNTPAAVNFTIQKGKIIFSSQLLSIFLLILIIF